MTAQLSGTGEELDAITADLDATGKAWVAAGYPFDGPEFEAREAVFARLKAWNAAVAIRQGIPGTAHRGELTERDTPVEMVERDAR